MKEDQNIEKKSIRILTGNKPDWKELAKDAVCFANARGGKILIGIEDDQILPQPDQIIDPLLPAQVRKRISELTIVSALRTPSFPVDSANLPSREKSGDHENT